MIKTVLALVCVTLLFECRALVPDSDPGADVDDGPWALNAAATKWYCKDGKHADEPACEQRKQHRVIIAPPGACWARVAPSRGIHTRAEAVMAKIIGERGPTGHTHVELKK